MSGNDLRQRAFAFAVYENEGLFADNYLESEHRLLELRERLQRQIAATDQAIDELVYELYDLTCEEIAIVEEAIRE